MCTFSCAKVHSYLCKKGPLTKIFTTPMKFASLLIGMNFIGQAETQRAQSFWFFLLFADPEG